MERADLVVVLVSAFFDQNKPSRPSACRGGGSARATPGPPTFYRIRDVVKCGARPARAGLLPRRRIGAMSRSPYLRNISRFITAALACFTALNWNAGASPASLSGTEKGRPR